MGMAVSEAMVRFFNLPATTLLLIAIFLFALTVTIGLSWFRLMDQVGALTLKAGLAFKALFTRAGNKAEKPERPAKPEPEPPVIRDKVAADDPDSTKPKSGRWWNRLFSRRAKPPTKSRRRLHRKSVKNPGWKALPM